VSDTTAQQLEKGPGACKCILTPAGHDDEARLTRGGLPTGDRSIDELHSSAGEAAGDGAGSLHRRRAHVDHQGALCQCRLCTAFAEQHRLNSSGVGDHEDERFGATRRLLRRCSDTNTGTGERFGLGAAAVLDGELGAGGSEMADHPSAHDAGTDEADSPSGQRLHL
jgi:hypothetical protein